MSHAPTRQQLPDRPAAVFLYDPLGDVVHRLDVGGDATVCGETVAYADHRVTVDMHERSCRGCLSSAVTPILRR
jgi:hypothetical protein